MAASQRCLRHEPDGVCGGLAGTVTERHPACWVQLYSSCHPERGSSPGTSNISYNEREVMSAALMRVFREFCSLQLEGDRGAKRRLRDACGARAVVEPRTEVARKTSVKTTQTR